MSPAERFRNVVSPIALLILAGSVGVLAYRVDPTVKPAPAPVTADFVALGKGYAVTVSAACADAWEAAASKIEAGGSVAESIATLNQTWHDSRQKVFLAKVAPALAAVLPAGTEPTDAAHRVEIAKTWRAFAKGLRSK